MLSTVTSDVREPSALVDMTYSGRDGLLTVREDALCGLKIDLILFRSDILLTDLRISYKYKYV